MLELHVIILFVVWFMMIIMKKLIVKKGDVEIALFVLVLAAHLVFVVFELHPVDVNLLNAILYGSVALTLLFLSVQDLYGKNRSQHKHSTLKKEHKQIITSYESLRKRFIATIELMKDGLSFRSDDGTMFGTDRFLSITGLKESEMMQTQYEDNIHPEDLSSYQHVMKKLSRRSSTYEVSYRFRQGHRYVWLKEKGTLIYYEDRYMIISMLKSIDVKLYPDSEVEALNALKFDYEFFEYLQSINRLRKPYHLILIELSNIPSINKRFGRDIGDLMMGEFLNKIKYNFVKDEKSLFRLTGIRFALVIKDERKYEILERALKHGGDLLNFEMSFGSVKQSVYPYFGIQYIKMLDEPIDEIVARTDKALEIALSEDNQENYFIIG